MLAAGQWYGTLKLPTKMQSLFASLAVRSVLCQNAIHKGCVFMCIINFHVNEHPNYKLIVVANRDEFYKRPTAAAHFWEDAPELFDGRNPEAKGTWLGMTKTGKFAALTNIRDASIPKAFPTSRGDIVTNFFLSEQQADDYLSDLVKIINVYAGFNVLDCSIAALYYLNNTYIE